MDSSAASPVVLFGIPGLALAVAGLLVLGAHASSAREGPAAGRKAALRALGYVGLLLGGSALLAARGVLADASRRPPALMPLMASIAVGTVLAARSPLGRRMAANLPLWVLVGAQGFRLPLELVMRHAAEDGVMPQQMSFAGWNFDVVTGVTALVLAALLRFGSVPRVIVVAWNALGSALLAVIVTIAMASAPWFAAFGPDRINEFVLHFPFVWLATVLVPSALFGHLVVLQRLRSMKSGAAATVVLGLTP